MRGIQAAIWARALDIAGHRGEPGSRGREDGQVLGGPVPDLHCEPEIMDASDALLERHVRKTISAQTAGSKP
jgi:hypothetical protein